MQTRRRLQTAATRGGMKALVWLYRRTGGSIGGTMRGAPVLLLTTTGRKTGRRWTVPVIYGREDDRLVLVASAGGGDRHPAWWLNLRDIHRGQVQLGSDIFDVIPHEAEGQDRSRLWAKMRSG